jgi:hypothetical protein
MFYDSLDTMAIPSDIASCDRDYIELYKLETKRVLDSSAKARNRVKTMSSGEKMV